MVGGVTVSIHQGKNKIWNKCGNLPPACPYLDAVARMATHRAVGGEMHTSWSRNVPCRFHALQLVNLRLFGTRRRRKQPNMWSFSIENHQRKIHKQHGCC